MIGELIITAAGVLLAAWVGGVQYMVRKMQEDLAEKMDKDEVRELIEDKMEAQEAHLKNMDNNIEHLRRVIDQLIFPRGQ